MDEIKPVARVTGEGEIGSPIGVGRMWDWPADGSHLYDQQAIDSLRDGVEVWRGLHSFEVHIRKEWQSRAERAEAEADALRKDAERFKWVSDPKNARVCFLANGDWAPYPNDLAAAIDAATKEQG